MKVWSVDVARRPDINGPWRVWRRKAVRLAVCMRAALTEHSKAYPRTVDYGFPYDAGDAKCVLTHKKSGIPGGATHLVHALIYVFIVVKFTF